jgi:hypothetical protein
MKAMMVEKVGESVVQLGVVDFPVRTIAAVIVIQSAGVDEGLLTSGTILLQRVKSIAYRTQIVHRSFLPVHVLVFYCVRRGEGICKSTSFTKKACATHASSGSRLLWSSSSQNEEKSDSMIRI